MKFVTLLSLLFAQTTLLAQADYTYPSLSPKGAISQAVGNTNIQVVYERPAVRNREIFGELVPWNKVWRTGAGHCTKIGFDLPVRIAGNPIAAGMYSLFTLPRPNSWTVIINSDTTLYGSYDYSSETDIARFEVIPRTTNRFYESLTIDIDVIPNDAQLFISWAHTQIDFAIETTTDEEIMAFIHGDLHNKKYANVFAGAAAYLHSQNIELTMALELAQRAIDIDPSTIWAHRIKMEIFEQLERYQEALEEISSALETARARDYEKEQYRAESIKFWEDHRQRIRSKLN